MSRPGEALGEVVAARGPLDKWLNRTGRRWRSTKPASVSSVETCSIGMPRRSATASVDRRGDADAPAPTGHVGSVDVDRAVGEADAVKHPHGLRRPAEGARGAPRSLTIEGDSTGLKRPSTQTVGRAATSRK